MRNTAMLLALLASAALAFAQGTQSAPAPSSDSAASNSTTSPSEAPAESRHHWPPPPEKPPAPAHLAESNAQSTGVAPEQPADPALQTGHPLNPTDVNTLTAPAQTSQAPTAVPQVYTYGVPNGQFGVNQFGMNQFGNTQFGFSQFGAGPFVARPHIRTLFGPHTGRNFIFLGNTGFGMPAFIPVVPAGGTPTVFFGFSPW